MRGAPAPLWDDDPDERRRRMAAALERLRAREAEEADWVVYLPASRWYVEPKAHRAAEWAAAAAAEALGLPFVPAIKWFREAGPTERETDHPAGFRDRPGVGGYVADDDPHTVWLSTRYCEPGAAVVPSLQEVVAHECEHVRQCLGGQRGRTETRERLAELTAAQLMRGERVAR